MVVNYFNNQIHPFIVAGSISLSPLHLGIVLSSEATICRCLSVFPLLCWWLAVFIQRRRRLPGTDWEISMAASMFCIWLFCWPAGLELPGGEVFYLSSLSGVHMYLDSDSIWPLSATTMDLKKAIMLWAKRRMSALIEIPPEMDVGEYLSAVSSRIPHWNMKELITR